MEHLDKRSHQYQVVPKYERSEKIGSRRKALFPPDSEDSNSDLGPMSPLSDNSPDSNVSLKNLFPSNKNCSDDYHILNDSFDDLQDEESIDLSYNTTHFDTPCSTILNLTADETPPSTIKKSPSSNLKTPHDSTNNTKLPRLSRKMQENDEMETNECEEQSIETNGTRTSKVRTALFPDVLPLSTKSFYPKTTEKKPERQNRIYNTETQKPKPKARVLYLCNRISRRRNREGQINNGVRHNIRKPKARKAAKVSLKKGAMSKAQGTQILEYIQDLNNLNTSTPKQIQPLNTIAKKRSVEENKENAAKPRNDGNKFFRNASRKIMSEDDKIALEMEKTKAANDLLDLLNEFNDDSPTMDLNNIIHELDEKISPEKIILTASNKVTDSDNSIMIHSTVDKPQSSYKDRKRKLDEPIENIAETLLSPTSQMCDMASGLAIRSPKRARLNINNILENDDLVEKQLGNVFNDMSSSSAMESRKLYPVFYKENRMKNKEKHVEAQDSMVRPTSAKKFKLSADQMLLDAGQKKLGITQCFECNIVYNRGDPDDEANHLKYHNAVHILRFQGWKNERIVGAHCGNRIIKIVPDDSKIWLKKVHDLLEVINRDLGFVEQRVDMENYVYYLYIKDKRIAGCLVAELKTTGFKMLSSVDGIDLCSEEPYPIKCGISRIWVSHKYRKQRIASAMMDCVRKNFMFGYVLKLEDIGMSTPTDLGKLFAAKYFQTPNYLIYTS